MLLQKHTHTTGRFCTLCCGFGLEPEGNQPWAGRWKGVGQSLFACTSRWGCRAPSRRRDVCQLHSVRTCLLVGNLMVHIRCGLCNWMTAHRGLGINYTLERCVSVCGAVVLGKTLGLSCTPCVRAAAVCGVEPWLAICILDGFHRPHQAASAWGDVMLQCVQVG